MGRVERERLRHKFRVVALAERIDVAWEYSEGKDSFLATEGESSVRDSGKGGCCARVSRAQEAPRLLGTAERGIGGRGSGDNSKAKATKSDFEESRVRAVTGRRSKEHRANVPCAERVSAARDGKDH